MTTALAAGALATLAGLTLAPAAQAYPVGPWGIEGPCQGKAPAECDYVPSPDGIEWKWYSKSSVHREQAIQTNVYDKTGALACVNNIGAPPTFKMCPQIASLIRALPPMRIGPSTGSS
ncbi:hypothetical protein [Nocardia cyriacigeorgica]|uniref:hypothetical protein n=1 Tax=Nocardia cyriacigeorgica TaxID=135487 RepID=UPI00281224BE|nr:hypothetical protein [Nocardia cyriacigeorgica]